MQTRTLVLVLALFAVPLAGCFGGDEVPAERTFMASGGKASRGWAYDGAGIEAVGASLDGMMSDADNTGIANITFDFAGSTWVVTFDTFAASKDFQDGGIEFELDEHGDTGTADASIPKIHATLAAWGSAKVMRDGALATPEPWTAHLMISADTVRGADGKIAKADGTTPYDPSAPADARRVEGDAQALLSLKHPQGETFSRAPVNVTAALSCAAPQCAQSAELAFEEGADALELNVTVSAPSTLPVPAGPLGQGRVAIVDANGTELAGMAIAPNPQAGAATPLPVPLEGAVFPLTVQVTGDGVFDVTLAGTATYSDVPFIVLTWDEVTVG